MDGIHLCTTHGHEMVFVSLMRTPHYSTAVVREAMNAVLLEKVSIPLRNFVLQVRDLIVLLSIR